MIAGRSEARRQPHRAESEAPSVVVVRAGGEPSAWRPPEPTPETGYDVRYFGGILAAAQRQLRTPGVRFVLTFERRAIPIEGDDVVVLTVGDDDARVPPWTRRVLATFKSMGVRPQAGALPSRHYGAAATALGLHARARLRHAPGAVARVGARARDRRIGPVHELPLGYHTQLELPVTPIGERPLALSFEGSVRHWSGRWGDVTGRLAPPKVYARRRMLEALAALGRAQPQIPIHARVQRGFFNVSPVTGSYDAAEARRYSRVVMDTRLLLAPQGTNPETSRHFQGLRAGCVVVTDVVPDRWYLRGAPFVVVPDWQELERAVMPLLEDPARLARAHQASLRWWRERCAEDLIGAWLASRVDMAAAARDG